MDRGDYDGPSNVEMRGMTDKVTSVRSINVYLDGLEKELALYNEALERLAVKAEILMVPERPSPEEANEKDGWEASPVGRRIQVITRQFSNYTRALQDLTSRLET